MTSRFENERNPASRTILNAYRDCSWVPNEDENDKYYKFSHKAGIAAALRAAADQLTPYSVEEIYGAAVARNKLLTIADELEKKNA